MTLLEATVHGTLRSFLREKEQPLWNHHLTMARLVSRGLRLGRSAIIQTGSTVSRYGLSYLMPALLSDRPVLLVAPIRVQQRLLQEQLPCLQEWLQTDKVIKTTENSLVFDGFQGLLMVSPQVWLNDRLTNGIHFRDHIPTLIDDADNLEKWTRDYLTITLTPDHWQQLKTAYSAYGNLIQEVRFYLKNNIFSHPNNPYECYLIEGEAYESLQHLGEVLTGESLFKQFCQQSQQPNQLVWASIDRQQEEFSLHISPLDVASILQPIWQRSPVVLMGGFLDADKSAKTYRETIGLTDDILCLKFSANRQNELIRLYIKDRFPLPNTPEFQGVLINEIIHLVRVCHQRLNPIVIIVNDTPLKAQVGTALAAEFGSRVQVEKIEITDNSILISGWEFWDCHQEELPIPQLLVMATLPIPSLENPLVAARVTYCKRQHKDWFRSYLLPTALKAIQRAVMPLRESQGIVALLDNRVNYRSYGHQIFTALEPYAKINYIDASWFE